MPRFVIFANGEMPDAQRAVAMIQPGDMIVCADGGTHHALALGLIPHMIVGDLDSLGDEDRANIEARGVPVQRHSHDKNETDLELALLYTLEQKPAAVVIVGALGKRLDQALGNIAMLGSPALASLDIRLDDGLEEAFFCRARSVIEGRGGDIVSLIPWEGPVEGVTTSGLKWPLHSEMLYPDKTRGISNEMLDSNAAVTIASGLLLIIHRRQSQTDIKNSESERIP